MGLSVHFEAKHVAEKKYPCDVCGKLFTTVRFMKVHRKEQHERGDSRRVKCIICNSQHLGKDNLKKHMRSLHSEVAFYECKVCHSKFKKSYSLKVNIKISLMFTIFDSFPVKISTTY